MFRVRRGKPKNASLSINHEILDIQVVSGGKIGNDRPCRSQRSMFFSVRADIAPGSHDFPRLALASGKYGTESC
jgi:hypothetical protein